MFTHDSKKIDFATILNTLWITMISVTFMDKDYMYLYSKCVCVGGEGECGEGSKGVMVMFIVQHVHWAILFASQFTSRYCGFEDS